MSTIAAPSAPDWRDDLLAWYDAEARRFPWRAEPGTRAPAYWTLLSEVMLQQTGANVVAARFEAFLARFATLEALAAAELDAVLVAWAGLGYYRRARGLHACARAIVERHGGEIPSDRAALLALPGIGAYTADAVRAIAFDHPVLPVDGNIRRVLARLERIEAPPPALDREALSAAERWRPMRRPGDLAQAMMDLGAAICRPRSPRCAICPIARRCASRDLDRKPPAAKPRKAKAKRWGRALVAVREDGAIWLRRRPASGVLAGMIEAPGPAWTNQPPEEEAPPDGWRAAARTVEHVFTHFALALEVWIGEGAEPPSADGFWADRRRLDELALPRLTRKVLEAAEIDHSPERQASGR